MKSMNVCKTCSLSSKTVFGSLTTEESEQLEANLECYEYKKGEIIYKEGSRITGFYCVKKGVFKIYKTGIDSKPQIVAFAQKGDITGYRSVLSNEPACTTVESLEDSEVCYIPSSLIFEFISKNSNFALSLIQLTCKELNTANDLIKDIAQKTVRERLAETLLMLDQTFGKDEEGFINVNLTREDISSIIGTATESVIRILSEFKTDGLISLKGKKIGIGNYSKLESISNSFLK